MLSLTSLVKSPYHKVPPGPKFFLLMIASITLFLIGNIYLQAAALAFVLGLYLLPGGTFFKEGLRMLWPLWPFVGIVFLKDLNSLLVESHSTRLVCVLVYKMRLS